MRWRSLAVLGVVLTLLPLSLLNPDPAAGAAPKDYDVPNGHFYAQANGDDKSPWGFSVSDNGGDLFWSEFKRYGGVNILGYPISRRFMLDGFPSQAFQKGILQWRAAEKRAVFVNVFDRLSTEGLDDWLKTVRSVPGKTIPEEAPTAVWAEIVSKRQAVLEAQPNIRNAYNAVPDPILQYGLPTSRIEEVGNAYVVRLQRAVIQMWKIDVPWAKAGDITVANGGDIFKEAGLIEGTPAQPHAAPGYESEGPQPVLKAITKPSTSSASASKPAAGATPVPGASGTTAASTTGGTTLQRQIDPRKRTMPAYLQEVPSANWAIVKLHQLTACENAWMGIGFFEALDKEGKPLDGVTVVGESGDVKIENRTGVKGPGKVEQYFYRGNWTAYVTKDENGNATTSDRAVNMETMIFAVTPEEQAERFCKGQEAITTGHYSYAVTFRKIR